MASEYPPIEGQETGARPARPFRSMLIVALIAFLLGLVAMGYVMKRWGGGTGYFWRDAATAPQPATALPAASPQLSYAPAAPATLDELSRRVRDLESRLGQINASAQAASGNASRAEGLLVAFAARRALDRGVALGYIERQLSERFGERQPRAVAMVIAAARQPVTLEQLQIALTDLTPQLSGGGASPDWWESLRREIGGLIVIRRTGTPSPAPAARLQRAKRALEGGQVDAALAEVARMPGRNDSDVENWMANARRYIEARRALDIIETAAILERRDTAEPVATPTQSAPPAG